MYKVLQSFQHNIWRNPIRKGYKLLSAGITRRRLRVHRMLWLRGPRVLRRVRLMHWWSVCRFHRIRLMLWWSCIATHTWSRWCQVSASARSLRRVTSGRSGCGHRRRRRRITSCGGCLDRISTWCRRCWRHVATVPSWWRHRRRNLFLIRFIATTPQRLLLNWLLNLWVRLWILRQRYNLLLRRVYASQCQLMAPWLYRQWVTYLVVHRIASSRWVVQHATSWAFSDSQKYARSSK